jgi:hypothetical protein
MDIMLLYLLVGSRALHGNDYFVPYAPITWLLPITQYLDAFA